MKEIILNRNQYLEAEKISFGAYLPLSGFMTEKEFYSVVDSLLLPDGSIFSIPIFLDISQEKAHTLITNSTVKLKYENEEIGVMTISSVYLCNKEEIAKKIFGTTDKEHPGVVAFYETKDVFIGGKVAIRRRIPLDISQYELTPVQTKAIFKNRKWKSVVAFHTRNAPHCAHEWLQRKVLELYDGLFIQPILGRKKPGDFNPKVVIEGYKTLISEFYPNNRVVLSALTTCGRYAGPREAVFHALVRRNYGCTHIIIGRDHAGVRNYYGKYDSQNLCAEFEDALGIKIVKYKEPFYCRICNKITTETTCSHSSTNPDAIEEVSGTKIRSLLEKGERPPAYIIRPEVIDAIYSDDMFVK